MWLFLPTGFYSIVQHRTTADRLLVRARRRGHLVSLCRSLGIPAVEIESTPKADYPFRITTTKANWAAFLADYARNTLNYDNFKDRAHQTRAHDDRALMSVWSTMRGTEERRRSG